MSHIGKGLMARCVNESNLLPMAFNMEGTDFLCDAPVLLLGNVGVPQVIYKSGFTMIDMSHDGDDGRLLFHLEFLVGI